MENDYKRIDLPGYVGRYEIDTEGNVFSLRFRENKPLKGSITNSGYLTVQLYGDNGTKTITVHRLVAQTFIPNPLGLPQINHKDENRLNNSASNLEWCTAKYNSNYGHAREKISSALKGRREPYWKRKKHSEWLKEYWKARSCKIVMCVNDGRTYHTYNEAARAYGIERHRISEVCKGIRKDYKGLSFKEIREVKK